MRCETIRQQASLSCTTFPSTPPLQVHPSAALWPAFLLSLPSSTRSPAGAPQRCPLFPASSSVTILPSLHPPAFLPVRPSTAAARCPLLPASFPRAPPHPSHPLPCRCAPALRLQGVPSCLLPLLAHPHQHPPPPAPLQRCPLSPACLLLQPPPPFLHLLSCRCAPAQPPVRAASCGAGCAPGSPLPPPAPPPAPRRCSTNSSASAPPPPPSPPPPPPPLPPRPL